MKHLLPYAILFLLIILHNAALAGPGSRSLSGNLHFIENKGQVTDQYRRQRPDIDFRIAAGNGLNIFIGAGKIHYQWAKHITTDPKSQQGHLPSSRQEWSETDEGHVEMYRMDVSLLHANLHAEIIAEQKQPYFEQYYLPHTGSGGAMAHTFRKVTYKEVYPHIDWVFYVNAEGRVEHDFIVRPGGRVSDIRLQYAGAAEMRLDEDGSVTAVTPFGSVKENTPYCFRQDGRQVAGKFVLRNNILGFATEPYTGILTIDPVLEWGTYFGGGGLDRTEDVITDKWGNVYIAGRTNSISDIATAGAHQVVFGGGTEASGAEAFLAKFNRAGACLWATYYGGDRVDVAKSLSCDTAGNVYMAGYTNSAAGIATSGTHQTAKAGNVSSYDAFLVKFDSAGVRLWGTYYGGTGADGSSVIDVACDRFNNVYLTGNTQSASGIASANGYITVRPGGHDMFLAKFTAAGTVDWSTYYGGSGNDYGSAVAVDSAGNVFVAGYTQSASGIATGAAYRTGYSGARDIFLAKFTDAGQPVWATYYGGDQDDEPMGGMVIDQSGNILIAGGTYSDTGIATPGCYQPAISEQIYGEGFVAKFSNNGLLLWGTYYGEMSSDWFNAIAVGDNHEIYIGGETRSRSGITTPDGYQPQVYGTAPGMSNGFLVKMNAGGQRLWGTYYGGLDYDWVTGLAWDNNGNIYMTGVATSASHIATANGYQQVINGGDEEGFLVRFNDCTPPSRPDTISGGLLVCSGRETIFGASGAAGAVAYTWILPAGWSGSSVTDTLVAIPSFSGGRLSVVAHSGCGGTSDTQRLDVRVSPIPVITHAGSGAICAGDTLQLEAIPDTAGTYAWLKDASGMPGAVTPVFSATAAGAYQVILNNGTCTDTSLPVTITVRPLPVPVIVNNQGMLSTTQFYAAYQWYFDGVPVLGAVNATYMATAEGDYAVEVTDTSGCSALSAILSIGDTRVAEAMKENRALVSVYPNPAIRHLVIRSSVAATLRVYTSDGKCIIRDLPVTAGTVQYDLASWSAGLYRLQLSDGKGNVLLNKKLLKQ